MNEVVILKNLYHPCIPTIYDIEEDEYYSYIIEEYIEGESLRTFRLNQKNINQKSILNYAIQICDLIQYLHNDENGILYLDLKPDNIIIHREKLKLVDFGASSFRGVKRLSYTFGTRAYAAPEQLDATAILDEKSDIYSIGKLLYFLVTGETFKESVEVKKWAAVFLRNKKLYRIIERCSSKDPKRRYQSICKLKEDLLCINQKRYGEENSFRSLTIAIAGSQERIGCTHIALFLTKYFTTMFHNTIYISCNDNNDMDTLFMETREVRWDNGVIRAQGCNFCTNNKHIPVEINHFMVRIKDYGVLTEKNMYEYINEEYKVFLIGNKPWEISKSIHNIKLLSKVENILFCINSYKRKEDKVFRIIGKDKLLYVPYIREPLERRGLKDGDVFGGEVHAKLFT